MSAAARARAAEAAARARGVDDGGSEEDRGGGTDDDEDGGDAMDEDGDGGGGDGGEAGALYGGAAWGASAAVCMEETALLTLGHLAAACPAVEARCVFLLVAHAASSRSSRSAGHKQVGQQPRVQEKNNALDGRDHAALAGDILTRLALGLGYRSRRFLVARHARAVGALWIRAGLPVQSLLSVPELAAIDVPSAAAAAAAEAKAGAAAAAIAGGGARETAAAVFSAEVFSARKSARRALAKSWAPALLPPAVLAGNGGAVGVLAELCHESDRGGLLREHLAPIFAQLFPLSRSTAEARRHEATAATAALKGPLLAQAGGGGGGGGAGAAGGGGGSLDMHYFRKLTAIVSEMTLLVQPPEPAPPPLDDDDDGSDEGGGGGSDPMLVDVGVSQAGGVVPSQQGVGPGDEEDTVRGREDAALAALTPPFLTPGEVIRAGLALPDLVSKSTNRRASEAGLYKLNPVYP
jgi:hypothetical protein